MRGEITIPERNVKVTLALKRNLDATLPASHTIDIQFTLPPDFSNAGIGNVPGILFKPSEEAGGSALTGLSVKVMSNIFLIGLSNAPADREQNLKAIRERSMDGRADPLRERPPCRADARKGSAGRARVRRCLRGLGCGAADRVQQFAGDAQITKRPSFAGPLSFQTSSFQARTA